MKTRNGKIARLPHAIRAELNRRLQDGEPGKHLVHWLNQSDQVRKILHREFGGRPISEQNLSEWKAGGYRDWLRHEESRQLVTDLAEHQTDLSDAAQGMETSDRYAGLIAVELVKLGNQLLADKTAAPERWQCLREILGQLSQLRRDDHRAVHTRIDQQRWLRQVETEDAANAERARKRERDKKVAPFYAVMEFDIKADAFGGGPAGRIAAAYVLEAERDLPPGSLDELVDPPDEASVPASRDSTGEARARRVGLPRRSVLAKAGASRRRPARRPQASACRAVASERRPERRPIPASRAVTPPSARSPEPQTPPKSNQIEPDQTESNQKARAAGHGHGPPEVPATGAASGSAGVPRAVSGVHPPQYSATEDGSRRAPCGSKQVKPGQPLFFHAQTTPNPRNPSERK